MCAIVDANVAHKVFGTKAGGSNRPEAGVKFFEWLTDGKGRLVTSAELRKEMSRNSPNFARWAQQALLAKKMVDVNESEVNARTEQLRTEKTKRKDKYKSCDQHILALAQVSGVRLLYSDDRDLQQDFKNRALIDNPQGKVYSTLKSRAFLSSHKLLLGRQDLLRRCDRD